SLLPHGGTVLMPSRSAKVDWEGELALVIGTRAVRVPRAGALAHVGGYTAFNDVSARDLQLEGPQWTAGKACDTFAPCGPSLVDAEEIGDPQALRLRTRVNGETVQDSDTSRMIFPVAELIEFI